MAGRETPRKPLLRVLARRRASGLHAEHAERVAQREQQPVAAAPSWSEGLVKFTIALGFAVFVVVAAIMMFR